MTTRDASERGSQRVGVPVPADEVHHVTRELTADLRREVSEQRVGEVVAESFRQLASNARIPTFLPVLAKRMARDRLQHPGRR